MLAHARAVYLGEETENWTATLRPAVRPCADFLVRAIADHTAG